MKPAKQSSQTDDRVKGKGAKKTKLNLSLTKSVFKKYKSLQNTIYKKYDTSSLVKSFND